MNPVTRIVKRFKAAGNVIPLGPKGPKVPLLAIHGRKYVLSNYWPAMSVEDEVPAEGGAKVVDTGVKGRFRYLWAYDTERGIIAMWAHSEGNEKIHERASGRAHDIVTLGRKGQLNRVTTDEFRQIERYMTSRAEETYRSLLEWSDNNQSDLEKTARGILTKWFDAHLRGTIDRKITEVAKGVIPLGFKVNDHLLAYKDAEQQARQWVVTQALLSFTQEKAYEIVSKELGFDAYDPPHGQDGQAVQWAYHAVTEKLLEEYLQ